MVVGIPGDMPAVFVDKPVMKTAEENQIVQICAATLGPVLDVVDLDPSGVPTSGKPAGPPVTVTDETTQPAGDRPGVTSHPDHDVVVVDDRFDNSVATQPSCGLVGNQRPTTKFGDTFGFGSQRVQIGMNHDLRRSRRLVSAGGTNFHQSVGHPL